MTARPRLPRRAAALAVVALAALLLAAPAPDGVAAAGTVGALAAGPGHEAGDPLTHDADDEATADAVRTQIAAARTARAGNAAGRVTVAGRGPAGGLRLTVDRTRDLINQTVRVSWTGGRPTKDLRVFDADYLQIMQCWGDDAAAGPTRAQCQFGGRVVTDDRGGANAASRKLNQGSGYRDPADPLTAGVPAGTDVFVPFAAVTGEVVRGDAVLKNPFYDASTTNEITFARTRGDGRGEEFVEIATFREAAGLGCGQVPTSGASAGKPRACWLVIVPRGDTEVDGTPWEQVFANGSHRLDTSPLSATNWRQRLVVPLDFAAAGSVCSLTATERPIVGVESGVEAAVNWRNALCRGGGSVFAYAQVGDAVAERNLLGEDPAMVVLDGPVDPADVPEDRVLVYAPLTVSGIVIGVQIDRRSREGATDAVRGRDGERVTEVNLTPRLVAKLLTQSYTWGVGPAARYLRPNPDNITRDEDFLRVNPQFRDLSYDATIDVLTPSDGGHAAAVLWRWIGEDVDAADFLAGLPDPWGMRINPFYQGLEADRDTFPKVDPFCDATIVPSAPPLCAIDVHPFSADMRDGVRSAVRGDTQSRTNWDATANPPAWKKANPQLGGERRLMAFGTTSLTARYGLVEARLRNARGQFVAPDDKGLRAGLAGMSRTAVPGVVVTNPSTTVPGAYPLTVVSYAVAPPNKLSPAAAKDYARFLRFAADAGQVRGQSAGQLVAGYLPLDGAQRAALRRAATAVERRVGPAPGPSPRPTVPRPTGGSDNDSGGGSGGGGLDGVPQVDSPAATPSPEPVTAPVPTLTTAPQAATRPTAAVAAGKARWAVVASLVLGTGGLLLGPLVPRLARRLRT